MITLRKYQEQILHNTYRSMVSGFKRPLVVLPTGAGKTAVFAEMARRSQLKSKVVWFLVHRRELLEQTLATFDRFDIQLKTIHVGMVGSRRKFPEPDLIVLDEAHHSVASTWLKIIDQNPDTFVIGLTATPARLDGKPLGRVFDDLIIGPSTADLIRTGWLSDYRYITSEVSLAGLGHRMGEFDQTEAASIMMDKPVMGKVVDTYDQHARGMQAIYFCTGIEHSIAMADEFNQAGIKTEHFDGTTPKQERKEIVARFRAGETQILTNVDLIGEGFDMPSCDAVGMLRPTESLTIFLQQSGRALRPAEGKTAVLIDHVGNLNRHGTPSDERQWSLNDQVKKGRPTNEAGEFLIRHCVECFAVYALPASQCPECGAGYVPETRELKLMKEIEMEELNRLKWEEQQTFLKSEKAVREAESYSDLCQIAKARGYKVGWAYHRAKQAGMWVPF